MFKRFAFTIFCLFLGIYINAQVLQPVKWSFEQKKISDDTYDLFFNAQIENPWHLYSNIIDGAGPVPTTFTFDESKSFSLIGNIVEVIKAHVVFDKAFGINVGTFDGKAKFKQRVKLLNSSNTEIKGYVNFMVCNDETCLAPTDVDFSFKIINSVTSNKNDTASTAKIDTSVVVSRDSLSSVPLFADSVKSSEDKLLKTETTNPVNEKKDSLWLFFFIAFGAGLITLLTPCVFPIIPMTVSFFMGKESKVKAKASALIFGISIVVIYTLPILLLTIITTVLGANVIEADFANTLATHWLPNVLFTIIFLFFAASFFGMFEIVLPSWLVNYSDQKADKGGFAGSFFMAFTLVLVSFSCTGPIVGSIIVQSLTSLGVEPGVNYSFGDLLVMYSEPTIGMLGFSLGIAIPFTLFALFPKWLQSMPKSGGWLNSVKVVLGFVELALALKFLSTSDLAYHWRILDREVYVAFWIVIFTLMGLYLLGKIKFSHDSDVKYLSVPRLVFAIITFTFVVYLVPGMWGAPLKALAGYLPPMETQDFNIHSIVRESAESQMLHTQSGSDEGIFCEKPKYASFLHLPHGLKGYFDLSQALECSKQLKKPVFVDFTGHGCVNCRKMEENVWSDPRVLKLLREEFVILALYVDDKTELPEKEWITSNFDGRVKKTIGKINADYQISRYKKNAQPYYVIWDENAKDLIEEPMAYTKDVDSFIEFLNTAIAKYKSISQ